MQKLQWICSCRNEQEAQGYIDDGRFPGYSHKTIFHPVCPGTTMVSEIFAAWGIVGLYGVNKG